MTLDQALDALCEKTDILDQKKNVDIIGNKAKELNKELETLVNRFRQLKEIDYDQNKIDYLYNMTEKSFESDSHVILILERLRALEEIHKNSTSISNSLQSVVETQPEIDERIRKETVLIQQSKDLLVKNVREI